LFDRVTEVGECATDLLHELSEPFDPFRPAGEGSRVLHVVGGKDLVDKVHPALIENPFRDHGELLIRLALAHDWSLCEAPPARVGAHLSYLKVDTPSGPSYARKN